MYPNRSIMKVVLTLLLVIFFGTFTNAQDAKEDTKSVTEISIVTSTDTETTTDKLEIAPVKENSVARLYRHKNARIKKALKFTTKRNRAKLA